MQSNMHFWWRFFPRKKLSQFYLSTSIRAFAMSLTGLFIPLYLYNELGYTLSETLIFFVFYSLIFAIFTPVAAKYSSKFGIKHSVLISVPLYLIFVILLYLLNYFEISLLIISSILGLSQAFYWMGLNLVFYNISDSKHRGEELGRSKSINVVSAILAPVGGGLLITYHGFGVVFLLAALLLFISALALFRSNDNHVKYHFSVRSIFSRDKWQDSLFFVSKGTHAIAGGVIWPLFIFLILGGYISLGIVGSIISGLSAIIMLLVGKYSDKVGRRVILRWTTGLESLSWFFRAMVSSVGQVFGATIFGSITSGFVESPLGALEYDKAKGDGASYFVNREIFICLGRILLLVIVMATNSLSGGLIFHGFMNFLTLIF